MEVDIGWNSQALMFLSISVLSVDLFCLDHLKAFLWMQVSPTCRQHTDPWFQFWFSLDIQTLNVHLPAEDRQPQWHCPKEFTILSFSLFQLCISCSYEWICSPSGHSWRRIGCSWNSPTSISHLHSDSSKVLWVPCSYPFLLFFTATILLLALIVSYLDFWYKWDSHFRTCQNWF